MESRIVRDGWCYTRTIRRTQSRRPGYVCDL